MFRSVVSPLVLSSVSVCLFVTVLFANLCTICEHDVRASGIPQHADFHAMPWNSLVAAEFAASPRKNAELPIFATFISNARFFGLLFNFTIYETVKSI